MEILSSHELAKRLAEALKGKTSKRITIEDCKTVLGTLSDVVTEAVVAGEKVRIHGFVDFFAVIKEAGTSRDPRTGETIEVPRRMNFKVKPSRAMKDAVKKAFEESGK